VVTHEATTVLLDLGPGSLYSLIEHLDLDTVDGVVISHQHVDHCADLLGLYHLWADGPFERRAVPLWAHEEVVGRFEGFLDRPGENRFRKVFDVRPVRAGDSGVVGSLRLRFAGMDHSVPTIGTRVESEYRSVFYTADTGPEGEWLVVAAGCTLMVAEASHLGDASEHPYRQHLTAGQAGSLAREAGARRLMLTHIPPHVDVTAAIAEAEIAFDRPVSLAVPGVTSEV
jgi:ribonuclease BN (tRNA processing enzyme)